MNVHILGDEYIPEYLCILSGEYIFDCVHS